MRDERALGLSFDGAFFTSESHASAQNQPGLVVAKLAREGFRLFRYMKAEEAFAIGQVAALSAVLDNADVDSAQAIGTTRLNGTGDFTANEFNDGTFPGSFVTIDAGTGLGQTRAIERNVGSTDYLDLESNGWDTALDTTSDFVTYNNNYVSLADTDDVSAIATCVMGVAISAITDEQWGWFQVGGFCPLVRFAGDTNPAVRGAPIVPSGAAGVAMGYTTGGVTATDASTMFGIACHGYVAADSAGRGIAAILNCRFALI